MKKLLAALLLVPMSSTISGDLISDSRQVVEMPSEMKSVYLNNMRDHMESLNLIIAALAENDLNKAAEVAETGLGIGHGEKRQCEDVPSGELSTGFGKFMPKTMKMMGMQLHISANDFADVAREGDRGEAYKSLRNISSACVACHQSFQVK